jgi:hypothetical protein
MSVMRNPWEPPPRGRQNDIGVDGYRAELAAVAGWLASHPAVPWSAEQMAERVAEVGQRRAALEALAAARPEVDE